MGSILIGSVSSTAAALGGMLRGGLPLDAVCGLAREHSQGVSDYVDLELLAKEAGIPFVGFRKVTEPAVAEMLQKARPDWVFVIGLSQLLPENLRLAAVRGAVGFHPTPLPEGRGRAPVAWTILLQRQAAANLFYLTDEADSGDIIAQWPVPVLPDDYAHDLIMRTNGVLERMVQELAPSFAAGHVPRVPQDPAKATWYAQRRPEDGRIDWNRPADEVYRLIRAVSHPYPGAFSFMDEYKVVIWRGRPVPDPAGTTSPPGTVIRLHEGLPLVQTADGLLQVADMEWGERDQPAMQAGMVLR